MIANTGILLPHIHYVYLPMSIFFLILFFFRMGQAAGGAVG
jgi:hypothetical protein